jgi:hypothetical protein
MREANVMKEIVDDERGWICGCEFVAMKKRSV